MIKCSQIYRISLVSGEILVSFWVLIMLMELYGPGSEDLCSN